MARRSGLPSNFELAALIILGYGFFVTFTSYGMTKRMPHFEGHKYDFYTKYKQKTKPKYTKIMLNKMGKVTSENSVGIMKTLPRSAISEQTRQMIETNQGNDVQVDDVTFDDPPQPPTGSPTDPPTQAPTIQPTRPITDPPTDGEEERLLAEILSKNKRQNIAVEPEETNFLALDGAPTKKLPSSSNRQHWFNVIKNSPMYDKIPEKPLKIALVTRDLKAGPTNHVMMDGMRNSDHLELSKICFVTKKGGCNLSPHDRDIDLWIIDANGVKTKAKPGDLVHQLLEVTNPHFQMLFIDYSDRFVPKNGFIKNHYPDVPVAKFEQVHIRFAIRCISKHRLFRVNKMPYVHLGTLVSPDSAELLSTKQGLPFHAPFAVRSDFVHSIHDLIPSLVANQTVTKTNPTDIPYHPTFVMDRPLDVTHLWEILLPSKNNDLRNLVTEKVQLMAGLQHPSEDRKIVVDTSIQGDRAHKGRWGVSDAYATTLLHSKIVVVTQRDQWEDHFRLFEATASGAMVLMDVMLSLPHSLQNGESVVFFDSLDELQEKALYYLEHEEERLAIARKGWEISMSMHRSWHRMEEMLFGRGVTDTRIEDSWSPNEGNE